MWGQIANDLGSHRLLHEAKWRMRAQHPQIRRKTPMTEKLRVEIEF
jgi:hypothetical protein